MLTGYLHKNYANSFECYGKPRLLESCGGYIIERAIEGTKYHDGAGIYPMFDCQDWDNLQHDMNNINDKLISLSLVANPFGKYEHNNLQNLFTDCFFPYKTHYVIDFKKQFFKAVSKNHKRNAKKAVSNLEISKVNDPGKIGSEWVMLYDELIRRHKIKHIAKFSSDSLIQQLTIPGASIFQAKLKDEIVGIIVFFVNDEIVYYHLAAYSEKGYEKCASFGIFWLALEYFSKQGFRLMNLGGGAGICEDSEDGLIRFKRGWATDTRTAYFCGKIFNKSIYKELAEKNNRIHQDFFPAYRDE